MIFANIIILSLEAVVTEKPDIVYNITRFFLTATRQALEILQWVQNSWEN